MGDSNYTERLVDLLFERGHELNVAAAWGTDGDGFLMERAGQLIIKLSEALAERSVEGQP
jgi:hypothetical protein